MHNDPVPEVGQGDRFSMDSDVVASSGWGTLNFILLSSLSSYFLSSGLSPQLKLFSPEGHKSIKYFSGYIFYVTIQLHFTLLTPISFCPSLFFLSNR